MSGEFTPPLDQAKSEAFAEQILGVLNSGVLSLMLSIGHTVPSPKPSLPAVTARQSSQRNDASHHGSSLSPLHNDTLLYYLPPFLALFNRLGVFAALASLHNVLERLGLF